MMDKIKIPFGFPFWKFLAKKGFKIKLKATLFFDKETNVYVVTCEKLSGFVYEIDCKGLNGCNFLAFDDKILKIRDFLLDFIKEKYGVQINNWSIHFYENR